MASTVLRTSALRGGAFRRGVSLPSRPLRRLMNCGAQSAPDAKLILLHEKMKELNRKTERGYIITSSLQKVVEERKGHNPFVQWLWQVGAISCIVFVEHRLRKK